MNYTEKQIKNRDAFLELVRKEFGFDLFEAVGVYYSERLTASMGVAGTEIKVTFHNKREDAFK